MHWVLWVHIVSFLYKVRSILRPFPQSTPFHNYQNTQQTTQHYRLPQLFKTEASGMKRRAEERTVVTCQVARPDLLRSQQYRPFDATAKYRQHIEQARYVTA
jgi:hypothetical protein